MLTTLQHLGWAAIAAALFLPSAIMHWARLLEVIFAPAPQQIAPIITPNVPMWEQPTQVIARAA